MKNFHELTDRALSAKLNANYTRLAEGRQRFIFEKTLEILNEDGADIRARRAEEARLRQAGLLKPSEELPSPGKDAAKAYRETLATARRLGLEKLMDISDKIGMSQADLPWTPAMEPLSRAESLMKDTSPEQYKQLRDKLVQSLVQERKAAFDAGEQNISEKDLLSRVVGKNKDYAQALTRDEYESLSGGITKPLRIETQDEQGNKVTQAELPRWPGMEAGAAAVYDVGAGAADVLTDPVQLGTAVATGGAFNLGSRALGAAGAKIGTAVAARAPAGVKAAAQATKPLLPIPLGRARNAAEVGRALGRTSVGAAGGALVAGSGMEAAERGQLARWSGEMLGSLYPFVVGGRLADRAVKAYSTKPPEAPKAEPSPAAEPAKAPSGPEFAVPPSGTWSGKGPSFNFDSPKDIGIYSPKIPEYANTGEMLRAFGLQPEIFKATKGKWGGAFTARIPEPSTKVEPVAPQEPPKEMPTAANINIPFYEPPKPGSQRTQIPLTIIPPHFLTQPLETTGVETIGLEGRGRRRRRGEGEVSPKPAEVPSETAPAPEVKVDFNAPGEAPFAEISPRPDYANTGEVLRAFGLKPEVFRATRGRQGGAFTATIPEAPPLPEPKTTLSVSDISAIERAGKPPESILSRAAREASAKPAEAPPAKPEISPKPSEVTPETIEAKLRELSPVSFKFPKPAQKPTLGRVAAAASAVPGVVGQAVPQLNIADIIKPAAEVRPATEVSVPKWSEITREPLEVMNGEQIARLVSNMTPKMEAPKPSKPLAQEPRKVDLGAAEAKPTTVSGEVPSWARAEKPTKQEPTIDWTKIIQDIQKQSEQENQGGMNKPVSLSDEELEKIKELEEPEAVKSIAGSPPELLPEPSRVKPIGVKGPVRIDVKPGVGNIPQIKFGAPAKQPIAPEQPLVAPSGPSPEAEVLPEPSKPSGASTTPPSISSVLAPFGLSTGKTEKPSAQPTVPEQPLVVPSGPAPEAEVLPEPSKPTGASTKPPSIRSVIAPFGISTARAEKPSAQPTVPEQPSVMPSGPSPAAEVLPEPSMPAKTPPKQTPSLPPVIAPTGLPKAERPKQEQQPSSPVSDQQKAPAETPQEKPRDITGEEGKKKEPAPAPAPVNVPNIPQTTPITLAPAAVAAAAIIGSLPFFGGPGEKGQKLKAKGERGQAQGGLPPGSEEGFEEEGEAQRDQPGLGTKDWNLLMKDIYSKYAGTLSK